jgi:hypothetical protein
MLSDQQFGGLAKEIRPQGAEDGGFTINHQTGKRPKTGYAVALAGSEEDRPLSRTTGASIKSYATRHDSSLNDPGVHLGGWGPGKSEPRHGRGILDNTRIVNKKVPATREMVMENQDAAYHLRGKQTITNVYKEKPKTFKEPTGFNRPQFERDVADTYRARYGRPSLAQDEANRRSNRRHS